MAYNMAMHLARPFCALSMTVFGRAGSTVCRMPAICRFLGITIYMYHREHGVPHFHAVYGEYEVSVELISGAVHGTFSHRALRHQKRLNRIRCLE